MQILWSDQSKHQLKEIYIYYKEVAGIKIAKSIKNKIIRKPLLLKSHPEIGQLEDNPEVAGRGFRYLVEGHHKIVYKLYPNQAIILIAAVFDTRMNPTSLRV
uniref:type II toxin-antitoxin system RelE/ParE family toxin n=1 Tax=Roseivirga sp. TaxID=1964215 RepID=UPI004047E6CB